MSRIYVYAVIHAEHQRSVDLPAVGDPAAGVSCLPIGSVAAVVSPTDSDEILSTRRNMLSHTKILEELNRDRPILPFRFGLIAANKETLASILAAREAELRRGLDELANVIEVGLKVTFVENEIFREIVAETPQLRMRSEALKSRPSAETYYERIELGREVGQRMAGRKESLAATLAARFAPFARKAVHHPTTEDMLVFNASYLIERSTEPALFAEVEKLENETQGRLMIRYVAPAPPYNFVSMRLDALPLAA